MIHDMVQRLGLVDAINRSVVFFKRYLPYSESDHVLNITYNLLAGGTWLECGGHTEKLAQAHGAKLVRDDTRHLAKIRHAGARVATGEIIVTIDAETRFA